MKLSNIFKAWRSTLLGLFFVLALFVLIWFEKLPEEATIAALALLVPVFTDWLKERKTDKCKHEEAQNN